LKDEVIRLKEQNSSEGAETKLSSEIDELRFHKEALENKLRKFAAHCQRLEDDKASMADALRSCNIDMEAHGNDISEAVFHVCDRLTSIENIETNGLSLEKKMQSMLQTIDTMTQTERKLSERLNQYRHEETEMKKQLESAKNEATSNDSEEKSEKLRFLENENLQLMRDLKSIKRQLQVAREELENLRLTISSKGSSDTFELTSEMVKASSDNRENKTSTRSERCRSSRNTNQTTASSKESSDTLELTNLAKACSEQKTTTVTEIRRSSRSAKKMHILSDSTNSSRNEGREENPTNKRQKVNEPQMNRRSSPGLGESSSHESEHTGDCAQS
jgi:hypothetical protein